MYCDFVNIVRNILAQSVPVKMVSIGPKDPEYVTPPVNHSFVSGTECIDVVILKVLKLLLSALMHSSQRNGLTDSTLWRGVCFENFVTISTVISWLTNTLS